MKVFSTLISLCCIAYAVVRLFGLGPAAEVTMNLPVDGCTVTIRQPDFGIGTEVEYKSPTKTVKRSFGLRDPKKATEIEAVWLPDANMLVLFEKTDFMPTTEAIDVGKGIIMVVMEGSNGRYFAGEIPEGSSYSTFLSGDDMSINGVPGHEITGFMRGRRELLGRFTSKSGKLAFEKN